MLRLSCCSDECSDSTVVDIDHGPIYPHSWTWDCPQHRWDCAQHEHSNRRKVRRVVPLFHMLVNTAYWIEDDMERIMSDRHVLESDCSSWCPHMYDLTTTPKEVSIGLYGHYHTYRMVPPQETEEKMEKMDKCFGRLKMEKMDKCFGSFNRYPCSYYRKCVHFDDSTESSEPSKEVLLRRLERLNRFVGGTRPIGKCFLNKLHKSLLPPKKDTSLFALTVDPKLKEHVTVTLQPGVYHWELVHHNWEAAVAAIQGAYKNRQQHFFLDRSGAAAPPNPTDRRMYISLMYRRVVHPTEDINDRYTTIRYFDPSSQHAYIQNNFMYFVFGSTSRDDATVFNKTKPKLVYMGVLTPKLGVNVYEHKDQDCPQNVRYYCVNIPTHFRLHSLGHNDNGVRLNLYIDMDNMSSEDKSNIGASIVQALHNPDTGYAFMSNNLMYEWSEDMGDVFKYFYQ